MDKNTALGISIVCHPVFVNLITFTLMLQTHPYLKAGLSGEAKWFYTLFIFITTSMIPLFVVVIRKALGYTSSIMLDNSDDRHIPYITAAFAYLFGYYLFGTIGSPKPIQAFMLAMATITITLLVVNFFTKISAHATACGALCAVAIKLQPLALINLSLIIPILFVISGFISSARLILQAHDLKQIYAGFLTGFFIVMLLL